jgi:hypothetical protein
MSWNPGVVDYLVNNGVCHTAQIASIDTATPAIADTVTAALDADSVKVANFSSRDPQDPDVKAVEINNIQKNGTHIAFMIYGWLSNAACVRATSATAHQTSFTTGHAAGSAATTPRVLGTVNLSDRHRIALMNAFTWFKQALKVLAVAVAYAAIVALTLTVIGNIAAAGGVTLAVAAQSALAGCFGLAAAEVMAARFLKPHTASTWGSRAAIAAEACLAGAIAGVTVGRTLGAVLGPAIRRRLSTTPAIMGDSGLAAAKQAEVDVTDLADLVDGVAEGALKAAQ